MWEALPEHLHRAFVEGYIQDVNHDALLLVQIAGDGRNVSHDGRRQTTLVRMRAVHDEESDYPASPWSFSASLLAALQSRMFVCSRR